MYPKLPSWNSEFNSGHLKYLSGTQTSFEVPQITFKVHKSNLQLPSLVHKFTFKVLNFPSRFQILHSRLIKLPSKYPKLSSGSPQFTFQLPPNYLQGIPNYLKLSLEREQLYANNFKFNKTSYINQQTSDALR